MIELLQATVVGDIRVGVDRAISSVFPSARFNSVRHLKGHQLPEIRKGRGDSIPKDVAHDLFSNGIIGSEEVLSPSLLLLRPRLL